MGDPAGGRRYTEEEMALVLRRAVELEGLRRDAPRGEGRVLTLREIQEIAREAGIDPALVERAAAQLDAPAGARGRSLLGPHPTVVMEGTVVGTLGEPELADLAATTQRELGVEGIVTEALGSVRWTNQTRSGATQVVFTPGADRTRIEVLDRHATQVRAVIHLLPAFWGGMIGVAVAASGAMDPGLAVALVTGSSLAGAAIGRGVWEAVAGWSRRKVRRLLSRLQDRADTLLAGTASPGGGKDGAPAP